MDTKNKEKLPYVARLYLLRQFFSAMYFSWPVWYGFASQYLTAAQVGIYFGVVYITQLVAEIPTGGFADKYGRRNAALIGAVLMPLMPLILFFGHSFGAYVLAAVLYGIAGAFLSGSLDSLIYDDRKVTPGIFRKFSIWEVTVYQSGLIISAAMGGFLFNFREFLPFALESLAAVVSLITIIMIKENPKDQTYIPSKYLTHLRQGFKNLLATPQLKLFVGAYILYAVAITASVEFVNEAAMIDYGIKPEWRGLLIALPKIFNLFLLNFVIYKLIGSDRAKILFMSTVSLIVFGLFGLPYIQVFLPVYVMFNWISASRSAFFHPILHDQIPSSHRSTSMSSLSALVGIASFALYPLAGWLIGHFDSPRAAYLLFFSFAILAIWLLRSSKILKTS